jgi:hypothetical protein
MRNLSRVLEKFLSDSLIIIKNDPLVVGRYKCEGLNGRVLRKLSAGLVKCVWSDNSPSGSQLLNISKKLIDAPF